MGNGKHQRVWLAAVGTATPSFQADQLVAADFFVHYFAPRLTPRALAVMRKFLAHPSIRQRHFAFDSPQCLVGEDPDQRVERVTRWAVELSAQAAAEALRQAGLSPREVSTLVVNTCTGYLCPGLSSYLLERLGLPRESRAYDLVGGGCGGAVPNLELAAAGLQAAGEGAALCVAVEICSATFQMGNDLSLILSNTLFGDGAAAAVLSTRPGGLELVAFSSRHRPEDREAIRYVHRQGELHNQLSRALPEIVREPVAAAVYGVLKTQGLTVADISHWALHSGGERVISALGRELGLPAAKLAATRDTLARYGNMSSPSALFTLRQFLDQGLEPGAWVLLASFGAGLSAHALLLRSS